jgi:hypothetical protein
LSEAHFWVAYFCAFLATLAFGFVFKRRLSLISIMTAALSSLALTSFAIWGGSDPSDPWLQIGVVINFGLSWVAAAVAIYIVKLTSA